MRWERLQDRLVSGPQAQPIAGVLTILGSVLALLTTLLAWGQAFAERLWGQFALHSVFSLFLVVFGYVLLKGARGVQRPATAIFQPFVNIDDLRPWPRPEEVALLRHAIGRRKNAIVLVIGASGVGKTVLLRRLFHAGDGGANDIRYFDSYELIEDDLEDCLAARQSETASAPLTIILDQFEQFVAASDQSKAQGKRSRQAWLKKFITDAMERDDTSFIISLRHEWYYYLRFLGNLIPAPTECIHIAAPSVDNFGEDTTTQAIARRLRQVVRDRQLAESVLKELDHNGGLLPLEVQLVGAVLEQARLRGERIDEFYWSHTIRGVDGAIERFFDDILAGARHRRVALKLLWALSARDRFRRNEELGSVVDWLHEERADVLETKDYLCSSGLVLERTPARLELAHDYVAEFFQQRSGSELNPTDRDNILFHLESTKAQRRRHMATRPILRRTGGSREFGRWVISLLLAFMILRLMGFGIPWNLSGSGVQPRYLFGNLLDVMYLPIFVTHAGWALYVYLFFERVFSRLNERLGGRALSKFMVLNMAACVITNFFVPNLWVALLGWGGLVVGMKMISVSRLPGMNPAAAARIADMGIKTAGNTIFVLIAGSFVAIVAMPEADTPQEQDAWLLINLMTAMAFTYVCYSLSVVHVSRAAASRILGLIARSDVGTRPSL